MKNGFKLLLPIGVSFAILALLLQTFTAGVPQTQLPSVWSTLKATTVILLLVYLLLYLVALLLRAYRYRLLLQVSGERNVPAYSQMVVVTGIRNMIVDLLPARVGELGYIALLNRGYGVALQHCTSSLTISIVFDLVAVFFIILLIVVKQLFAGDLQGWAVLATVSALGLSIIAVVGLFFIAPVAIQFLVSHLAMKKQQSTRWRHQLLELLNQFGDSLLQVRGAGCSIQITILSIAIRLLKYTGFYILFRAVSNVSFPEIAKIPLEQVVSALIGGELGASLPIPTFMSFGAYEAGSTLVFQILGVTNKAAALVTMLCVHIWSQMFDYLLGGALLLSFIIASKKVNQSSSSSFRWAGLVAGASVFVLGSSLLALELRATNKLGALNAPAAGSVTQGREQEKLQTRTQLKGLEGFVVFSSNRDGNHDIFRLDLADMALTKLTNHPHTETYPRISPDGKRLVFARAHQTWVSQRNLTAWDVYILDLVSGTERKLGDNSTAPDWLDNTRVSILKNANKVIQLDLETGAENSLFETGEGNRMPMSSQIHNPTFNAQTGELVFTAKQSHIGINSGHWGTAITRDDELRGLYNGCELSWSSDRQRLYQITDGGYGGGMRIVRIDPSTFEMKTMIDLDGEFNHEYWPRDSTNGEFIVFGASRGPDEHEHDTQDYEIFIWQLGSDPKNAIRLTFHSGNDNWPDVHIWTTRKKYQN